jgi:hypothetical protein
MGRLEPSVSHAKDGERPRYGSAGWGTVPRTVPQLLMKTYY